MELAVPDWCLPFQLWYLYSNHRTRKAAHRSNFPWLSAPSLLLWWALPVVTDNFLPPSLSDTFLAGLAAVFKVSIKAKPDFCSLKMYDLGQFRLYFYSILTMIESHKTMKPQASLYLNTDNTLGQTDNQASDSSCCTFVHGEHICKNN